MCSGLTYPCVWSSLCFTLSSSKVLSLIPTKWFVENVGNHSQNLTYHQPLISMCVISAGKSESVFRFFWPDFSTHIPSWIDSSHGAETMRRNISWSPVLRPRIISFWRMQTLTEGSLPSSSLSERILTTLDGETWSCTCYLRSGHNLNFFFTMHETDSKFLSITIGMLVYSLCLVNKLNDFLAWSMIDHRYWWILLMERNFL